MSELDVRETATALHAARRVDPYEVALHWVKIAPPYTHTKRSLRRALAEAYPDEDWKYVIQDLVSAGSLRWEMRPNTHRTRRYLLAGHLLAEPARARARVREQARVHASAEEPTTDPPPRGRVLNWRVP